jgi:hypothetical protein
MLSDVKPNTAKPGKPSSTRPSPSAPAAGVAEAMPRSKKPTQPSLAEAKAAAAEAAVCGTATATPAKSTGATATAPTPTPTPTPTGERRRSARKTSSLPAWLSDQSGGRRPQQQRVTVTDMSLHGVGFVANEKTEVGATHWIVIAADQLHLSTRLKIIFCRPRPDGTYDVGGEFF